MAYGGHFVGINGEALDQLAEALRASAGGVKDMRAVYENIASYAHTNVVAHAPGPYSSSKDGAGQPPPGAIKGSVKHKATYNSARVGAGGAMTPHIYIQEFGGLSYWHRLGAGMGRFLNPGHKKVQVMAPYLLAGRALFRGHRIYYKARLPRGYFIWNVAYHIRGYIGDTLTRGIAGVCEKHGILVNVTSTELGIEPAPPFVGGRAVAKRSGGGSGGGRRVHRTKKILTGGYR